MLNRIKNIFNLTNNFYTQVNIKNSKYKLRITKDMKWCFEGGEYYEKKSLSVLISIIALFDEKPVFYDIGANAGFYSIILSEQTSEIVAFEPFSLNYKLLKRNKAINNVRNLIVFKTALSDKKEIGELVIYNSSGNNSLFSRNVPKNHSLKKTGIELIELEKMDDVICHKELPLPNIVKIDVEGAELFVLKGAKKTIQQVHPTFVIEYSDSTSNDAGYKKEAILEYLSHFDYHFYAIPSEKHTKNLVSIDDLNIFESENIVATQLNLDHLL